MASPHCTKCRKKKPCNKYHVYVIELERDALEDEGYCKDSRGHITEDSKLYYVGQSWHRPECRYGQHKKKKWRRKLKEGGFMCACKDGKEIKRPFTSFNKPSKYPRDYSMRGGLRPELYRHLNPIRGGKVEAEQAEEDLALDLRKLGHGAHYN